MSDSRALSVLLAPWSLEENTLNIGTTEAKDWSAPSLRYFTVPLGRRRRVLWRTLRRPEGHRAFETAGFASAAARSRAVDHKVRASVHHHGVHAVGHRERLQVRFDGDGKRKLVDEVHRCAGDDGTAAQVLEAEDWNKKNELIAVFSGV